MSIYDALDPSRAVLLCDLRDQADVVVGANLVTGDPYDPLTWTAENAATLSRQAGVYLGTDALRTAYNGTPAPGALRNILTLNHRYRISTALRNNGATSAEVLAGTASVGLRTDGTFQVLSGDATCTGNTNLRLRANGAAGSADFAAISVYELKRATKNWGTAAGAPAYVIVGDGFTAASMPTQLAGKRGLNFNGSQYITAAVNLPNGAYTYISLVRHTLNATGTTEYLSDFRAGGGTGYVYDNDATRVVTVSSGTVSVNGVSTTTLQNGMPSLVSVAGITATAPSSIIIGAINTLVGANTFFRGDMLAVALYPGTLAPLQIAEVGRRMRQEALMP